MEIQFWRFARVQESGRHLKNLAKKRFKSVKSEKRRWPFERPVFSARLSPPLGRFRRIKHRRFREDDWAKVIDQTALRADKHYYSTIIRACFGNNLKFTACFWFWNCGHWIIEDLFFLITLKKKQFFLNVWNTSLNTLYKIDMSMGFKKIMFSFKVIRNNKSSIIQGPQFQNQKQAVNLKLFQKQALIIVE